MVKKNYYLQIIFRSRQQQYSLNDKYCNMRHCSNDITGSYAHMMSMQHADNEGYER